MTEPASAFTLQLFEELERRGIEHVVARRAELLPRPPVGDDIDVVLAPGSLPRIRPLLDELARGHGGACFSADESLGSGQYFLFFPGPDQTLEIRHLHFQDSISHHGVELVPGADMLRDRRREGRFWRPPPGVEAASLLLHDLVGKAAFRSRDLDAVRTLAREQPAALREALEGLIGAADTERVEQALQEPNADDGALLALRRSVRRRCLGRRPFRPLQWWVVHAIRTVTYVLRRRGALVVLIGPDGSGKTTLVDEAQRILTAAGRKVERVYFGSTTPLLPTKRLLKSFHNRRRGPGPQHNAGVPKKASFRSNLSYFLGAVHSLLDQYLRYWVYARPRLSRARILLGDRYFYDTLAFPAPRGLKWLLDRATVWLTPRPDVVLVLQASPEEIYSRKPELTVKEIERQQRSFLTLLRRPVHGGTLQVEPDPKPNALKIAGAALTAFGKRHG